MALNATMARTVPSMTVMPLTIGSLSGHRLLISWETRFLTWYGSSDKNCNKRNFNTLQI
jgi:hypothetical protein